MKLTLSRILSAFLMAGGWLLTGARAVLDLIGYSTAPEDAAVASARLNQFFEWLLSVPWWAVWGFALVSTMWLIWVSWPRQQPAIAQKVEAPADSPAVSDAPQSIRDEWGKIGTVKLIPDHDGDTADSHDPALEQLIRMYIVPASARTQNTAIIRFMVASERLDKSHFFSQSLGRNSKRLMELEWDLIHQNRRSEQERVLLQTIAVYYEIECTIDYLVSLLSSDDKRQLGYEEWKQADKEFKRQLTAFSSKRGYEKLYQTLERCSWIVT